MKKGSDEKLAKKFDLKSKELRKHIENLECQRSSPDYNYILRPDGHTEKEVNTFQAEIKKAYERLEFHLEKGQEQSYGYGEQNQSVDEDAKPNLKHHEWLYDLTENRDSNALTHTQTGVSNALVERHNKNHEIDSENPNAQLILHNQEEDRWQDGGVHSYDAAIQHAESHAVECEQMQQNEPSIDIGIEHDEV